MGRRQYTAQEYIKVLPGAVAGIVLLSLLNFVHSQRFQEIMNISFVLLGIALVLFLALNKKKIEERYNKMKMPEPQNDTER